jgi:hypothetical protein
MEILATTTYNTKYAWVGACRAALLAGRRVVYMHGDGDG